MNSSEQQQEQLKRRWDRNGGPYLIAPPFYPRTNGASVMPLQTPLAPSPRKILRLSAFDFDVASTIVPSVTVVLEGRSICHRVYLDKHTGYQSLAMALRRMFVDVEDDIPHGENVAAGVDLSNAVPGYVVAYEDMEDDLLLAGDLNWKDFVRVAKRIRIIPARSSRKKHCGRA